MQKRGKRIRAESNDAEACILERSNIVIERITKRRFLWGVRVGNGKIIKLKMFEKGKTKMKIKVYAAKTMEEAVESIRKELGAGAVVLHSEKKTIGDEKGKMKTMFEVVAAVKDYSSINSTETGESQIQTGDSTFCESMLDDDVEDMIDEGLLQTFIEETRIADGIGRGGSSNGRGTTG